MSKIAIAIFNNMVRLLRDAEILEQSGSKQSAAALTILAVEEFAKFLALKKINNAELSNQRSHVAKQALAGRFIIRACWMAAVFEHYKLSLSVDDETSTIYVIGDHHAAGPVLAGQLPDTATFDALLSTEIMQFGLRFFSLSYEGCLNSIKQKCFYVDEISADAIDVREMERIIAMGRKMIKVFLADHVKSQVHASKFLTKAQMFVLTDLDELINIPEHQLISALVADPMTAEE